MDAHPNFAYSTVATAPSPATSGLSLTLAADFPATAVPPYNATVWPAGAQPTPANAEIVRVTADAAGVLTLAGSPRAQEGSASRAIVVGDQIAVTITTKVLTDMEAAAVTDPHFIDWVTEYGVDNNGGGEAGNATAWANLMTDLFNKTTRGGIRDIIMYRPGDLIDLNTTCVMYDIPGVTFHFLSGPSFNEGVGAGGETAYFRWTGAANTYMFMVLNPATNWRPLQWKGSWNMATATNQQGWGLVIDNCDNWGGADATLSFNNNGGTAALQRGLTVWAKVDCAHGMLGRIFSNNVGHGAIYVEGANGFTVVGGNISIDDNQIGIVLNGMGQRILSDMVTNATTTITSATAAFNKDWDVGRPVVGTNIPINSYIKSVTSPTTAVISAAATGSGSGGSLTVGSYFGATEVKLMAGLKIDGGGSGQGGSIGVLNHGYCNAVFGCAFETFNSAFRSVANMVTNGTTTITSATAAFTAADAPSGPRPGREVSGTNIPAGTRIASVTNGTTAIMDRAATGSGSGGSLTIVNRAVAIDHRRVDNNTGGRCAQFGQPSFVGHDGTMLPIRSSTAPGVGSGFSNQCAQPVYSNCLAPSGGATDGVFFPDGNVNTLYDTWHDYYLLLRGALVVVD